MEVEDRWPKDATTPMVGIDAEDVMFCIVFMNRSRP